MKTPIAAMVALIFVAFSLSATTPGEAPLPSPDEVLKRVVERAARETENDRQFAANYTFTRVKRTETMDPQGVLQKRVEKSSTYHPVAGSAPSREPARTLSNQRGAVNTGAPREQTVEKKDFLQQADILKRFKFTVKSREQLDGRTVLLLEFVPASRNLPVRDFKDPFINRAAGRVWVDEAEAVVAKADMRLTGEVSLLLGLVGVVKSGLLQFERARTPEGWWFTRLMTWHLEGRELFTRKILRCEELKTNVRRAW